MLVGSVGKVADREEEEKVVCMVAREEERAGMSILPYQGIQE